MHSLAEDEIEMALVVVADDGVALDQTAKLRRIGDIHMRNEHDGVCGGRSSDGGIGGCI